MSDSDRVDANRNACYAGSSHCEANPIYNNLSSEPVSIDGLQEQLRTLRLRHAVLTRTVDAVASPLVIIDLRGRVIFENAAARAAIKAGDCLQIVGGHLEPAPTLREAKTCRKALSDLRIGRAATVRLSVGHAGRMVILSTAPFPDWHDSFASSSAAGLIWLIPAGPSPCPVKRVAKLFALTPAEERLLGSLSGGYSLSQVARMLQVSIHTARAQLKSIQRKTGWHTQQELARMAQQVGAIEPCY